jgi:hypothetical protein
MDAHRFFELIDAERATGLCPNAPRDLLSGYRPSRNPGGEYLESVGVEFTGGRSDLPDDFDNNPYEN